MSNAYRVLPREVLPITNQVQFSRCRRGKCYDNIQVEAGGRALLNAEELEARDWLVFAILTNAQASISHYFGHCND